MAHNYTLQVTAGPSYDTSTHEVVAINTSKPLTFSSEYLDVELNVRIQDYRGLPPSSPSTSPYFSLPQHAKAKDQYSIGFKFTPKHAINGDDLVFGNDFDHPIRDRLPPGFGTAFKIVKWAIDPGLDGDVYAEKPYLYGPLASSLNTFRVGNKDGSADVEIGEEGMVFDEGGDGDGVELRAEAGVPDTDAGRKKFFLTEENRKKWEYEKGRPYYGDFFNPYLDFNDFALRLPGFTLPIMKYWDGQGLRYVLKNRKTDTEYMVVLFTLYLKEDVDEEGNIKEGVVGGKPHGLPIDDAGSDEKTHKNGVPEPAGPVAETSADDVD